MELSFVIPLYKMPEYPAIIKKRLTPIAEQISADYEIILVDDGSADGTWHEIKKISEQSDKIRGIKLCRNFGQQLAVSSGISQAKGRYVIVMDGDMQNPPEASIDIVARLREGIDIVYTVSRVRNNWLDQMTSRFFWFTLTKLFGVHMIEDQLMMRGMSRRFVDIFNSYPEATRSIAGICKDIGMTHAIIEVENKRREIGKSAYSLFKRLDLMMNIVISITTAPLHYLIYVSLFTFIGTIFAIIYYTANLFLNNVPPGFTSVILSIFFFGSLTTLILGVIGLYLANIYIEVRRRPLFLIEEQTQNDT